MYLTYTTLLSAPPRSYAAPEVHRHGVRREPAADQTTPTQTNATSTALLRRRATRRAVLAGGVAAAGVAGAYAALGDRLKLFGEDGAGARGRAERHLGDQQESVHINHLLRRTGFGVTQDEYDRYQSMGLQATLDELLNYDAHRRQRGREAAASQKAAERPSPRADRDRLADAHGDDEAAVAGKDDPLLARPADQPDQRRARPRRDGGAGRPLPQHALDSFPDILKGVSHGPGDDDLPQHRRQRSATRRTRTTRASSWSCSRWAWATSARRTCARRRAPSPAGTCHASAAATRASTPSRRPSSARSATTAARRRSSARRGNFGPDDIVDIIVGAAGVGAVHRATPVHASSSTRTPPTPTSQPFVDAYMKSSKSIRERGRGHAASSDVFYSPKAYRALVKSPVEYTVGAIKAVNGQAALAELTASGGSRGWAASSATWGRRSTSRRTSRAGRATRPGSTPRPCSRGSTSSTRSPAAPRSKASATATDAGQRGTARRAPALGTAPTQALAHFLPLVLDDNVSPEMRQVLLDYAGGAGRAAYRRSSCAALVYLILGSPQFHLS